MSDDLTTKIARLERENEELRASLRRICGWIAAFGAGFDKLAEQEDAVLAKRGMFLRYPTSPPAERSR